MKRNNPFTISLGLSLMTIGMLIALESVSFAVEVKLTFVRTNPSLPPRYQTRTECVVGEKKVQFTFNAFFQGKKEQKQFDTLYTEAKITSYADLMELSKNAAEGQLLRSTQPRLLGGGHTVYTVEIDEGLGSVVNTVVLMETNSGRIAEKNSSPVTDELVEFININCLREGQ